MIKTIFRKTLFFRWARETKWKYFYPITRNKSRSGRLNSALKRQFGGVNASLSRLEKYKTSDTLFILAAGQTINNLTQEQLAEIKRHDSIGINGFGYHELVPTYLSFELENQHSPVALKMFQGVSKNILNSIDQYKDKAIIFRQYKLFDKELERNLKEIFSHNNSFWNVYDTIPGKSIEEYLFFLKYYQKTGLLEKDDFFPNKGSSLSWVISFAFKLKYEKIIICGVDLFGDHFYIDKRPLDESQFLEKINKVHLTNKSDNPNQIPVKDLILTWNENFFKPEGVKLFCGNKFSQLSDILPVYWK